MTSANTLEKLENWKKEFINQGGIDNAEKFPFIVIGNKCDRIDKAVDAEAVEQFCSANGEMPNFATSAKEGTGIQEAMQEVVRQAAKQKHLEEEEIFIPRDIDIGKPTPTRSSGGDCGGC